MPRISRERLGWMMRKKEREERERLEARVKYLQDTLQWLYSHGYVDGPPFKRVEAALLDIPYEEEQTEMPI